VRERLEQLTQAAEILCVNWFRKARTAVVWPGFATTCACLSWMIGRIEGTAHGEEHASARRALRTSTGVRSISPASSSNASFPCRLAWREELNYTMIVQPNSRKDAHGAAETKAEIEKRLAA